MMSMAKKRRRTDTRSLFVGFLIVVAGIAVALAFGLETAQEFVSSLTGIDLTAPETVEIPGEAPPPTIGGAEVTQPVEAPVEAAGTAEAYYSVYFTDPQYPDEGAHTGGIDQYLVALIDDAQYSIDAAFFELDLQSVTDALIRAHQRGVQVRIVYDDEHTEDDPQTEQLLDVGIPGTPDERSAFMHNKFVVIDGQIVWTGSWNLTENGTYRNNNNVIVIRSPELAANYTAEFEEMFNGQFGPRSPASTPYPRITIGGVTIENYFAPEDDVTPHIVDAIARANTSIHFMAFSFTDDSIGAAMLDRMANGVPVAGIFETRGADTEYSECSVLLAAGADARLDGNPYTFHHKVIIIDSAVVIVGSFNFSQNATESNDENLLIIYDPAVAAIYEAEFNRRLAEAVTLSGDTCRAD
jgi:phosphatidylserine/phosphatidylglycerophosphate/cardiolipin synthase-like enzyme